MANYRHILLAVDLSDEAGHVVAQGKSLSDIFDAKLSIVHVLEPLSFAYGGDIPLDFSGVQEEIQKQAQQHLTALAQSLAIPKESQHLVLGRPETEIHNTA